VKFIDNFCDKAQQFRVVQLSGYIVISYSIRKSDHYRDLK